MTFSFVAHDPATGALGITVAPMGPAVGAIVPYLRVGVGALATQSAGVFAHGPRGLDLLTAGRALGRADREGSARSSAGLQQRWVASAMSSPGSAAPPCRRRGSRPPA